MTKLEIIELVIIATAAIALIIWFGFKAIKNKWLGSIIETINNAIKEAEESKKTGKEKKEYVMQKVKEKCDELKIPYTLIFSLVSKLIDTIIKHYNIMIK